VPRFGPEAGIRECDSSPPWPSCALQAHASPTRRGNFPANDLHAITAIHRWFGAQLSEHGADAISE